MNRRPPRSTRTDTPSPTRRSSDLLGVVRAEVTTAHPISSDQEQRLRATLESMLEQQVKITMGLDPRLLAGFVARVGSRRYDASLSGQIERDRKSTRLNSSH